MNHKNQSSCVWHPCSQMKDYQSFPPLKIKKAIGSKLILADGTKIIDIISSWWCKSLGHGHPRLKKVLIQQAKSFEHVILANTTSDLIESLAYHLTSLGKSFKKVFFAGDGSTAIEIALKMSLQYQYQLGFVKRKQFAYLKDAYHGENILSYSVSDLGLYKNPFLSLCQNNLCLPISNDLLGKFDTKWKEIPKREWEKIEKRLNQNQANLAAIIVEPVVQGAGGMKIYSPMFLKKLRDWSCKKGILLIADEIMTGLGRTGKALACQHAGIEADIVCLMKGLTAGWSPFSAVLASKKVFDAFYDDYQTKRAFMHSNTFCGHALGARVALECLKIYEEENWFKKVEAREVLLRNVLLSVQSKTNCVGKVRSLGFMAACDLMRENQPIDPSKRAGYLVYQEAVKRGVLLRPLGDTLYLLPPYNITSKDLEIVEMVMVDSIKVVMKNL